MNTARPRIAIPEPNSKDQAYSERTWPYYAIAVEASGGLPVKVFLSAKPAEVAQIAASCSGILLPGSSADVDSQKYGEERESESADPDPAREAVDELLLQDAFNLGKPIFGICYGHQSLNVWKGGSLIQHLATTVSHQPGGNVLDAHAIVPPPAGSRLASIAPQGMSVNSSHHQAVNMIGDGLLVTGRSSGDNVIEAVEGFGEQYLIGVQWHPERTYDNRVSRTLFDNFIQAAQDWKFKGDNKVIER